jgi:hypothetical protein
VPAAHIGEKGGALAIMSAAEAEARGPAFAAIARGSAAAPKKPPRKERLDNWMLIARLHFECEVYNYTDSDRCPW